MKKKTNTRTEPGRLKNSEKLTRTLRLLKESYPDAKCALHAETPYQLLVATVLSAQCTDERVNKVTPKLFQEAPDAQAMVNLGLPKIRKLIGSINFFNNKAKALYELSKIILEKHEGKVPQGMEALVHLPGVGRKTANVVLGNAYGVPSLVVDTHVTRLANRLGWVGPGLLDAEKIELELQKLIPEKLWVLLSHWLILHGRAVCGARKKNCEECVLNDECPSVKKDIEAWKVKR